MSQLNRVVVLPGVPIAPAAGTISYVQEGTTAHFVVQYDSSLGAAGATLADAVLARCEADYGAMVGFFGGSQPGALPVTVAIDLGFGGAFHGSCSDTQLHLLASAVSTGDAVNFLEVAELSECFMAAQGKWNCGDSSGEALSRLLATEQYPAQLDGFSSAQTWLNNGRPNWVDATESTDRDYLSIGCAVLFLNYLRYQLGFTLNQIIAAGAPTLAQTYTVLTGRTDAWQQFSQLVAARYPPQFPVTITGDNIFPITFPLENYRILTTHWLLMADLISRHGLFPVHPQPDDRRSLQAIRETLGELRSHITAIETAAGHLSRPSI